jgi:hypothetical protein
VFETAIIIFILGQVGSSGLYKRALVFYLSPVANCPSMGKAKEHYEDLKKRIIQLHKSGNTDNVSSHIYATSYATQKVTSVCVQTFLHKNRAQGTTKNNPTSGHKPMLAPTDEVHWLERFGETLRAPRKNCVSNRRPRGRRCHPPPSKESCTEMD